MENRQTKISIERARDIGDFNKAAFAIKALAPGKHPHFTTVLHAEPARCGTRLVATDGKRLHVALVRARIPKGDYTAKASAKEITLEKCAKEIRYPSWKNVLPEKARFKGEIDLAGTNKGRFAAGAEKLSVANSMLAKKTGRMVNFKFLSDLPEKTWNVYAENSKTKPIVLKDLTAEDSAYAVISPLAA